MRGVASGGGVTGSLKLVIAMALVNITLRLYRDHPLSLES